MIFHIIELVCLHKFEQLYLYGLLRKLHNDTFPSKLFLPTDPNFILPREIHMLM